MEEEFKAKENRYKTEKMNQLKKNRDHDAVQRFLN
jgi:hypothetical protein